MLSAPIREVVDLRRQGFRKLEIAARLRLSTKTAAIRLREGISLLQRDLKRSAYLDGPRT